MHIYRERDRKKNDYGSKAWYLADIKISGKWKAILLNMLSIDIDRIAISARVRTWFFRWYKSWYKWYDHPSQSGNRNPSTLW